MKQTSSKNDSVKSNVIWKESFNRTASFNKIGSCCSLVKDDEKGNLAMKIREEKIISLKSKESNNSISL